MTTERDGGFTLIELIIVVAIVAVLAVIAVPSFRDMIIATRVRTDASDLYDAMLLARSEAIKRVASVDVVPSGGDWTAGWEVRVGSTVLSKRDAATNSTISADAAGNVTYGISGRISTGVRRLTVSTTASTHPIAARCVLLDASGRPSVRTDTDGNPANGCN